jgi:RHS repeat-associated protein
MGQTPTGTSEEVGITEGQLSVSLSGGATYSIPIAVPPGVNGVVPQVGLTYNSQAGNGMAGYGWNISGVSAITRIPADKFHDGVIDAVDFDALDRFALDGQRLVVKNGTNGVYGADGTVYETENFSNVKVTSYGVHPSRAVNAGPAYFIVEYPDGSKAYYDNHSTDSRSITDWAITYWENPQGVRISYSYILSNNNLSIEYIKYGGISTNTPINQIKFVYKARIRPEQAYVGGQLVLRNTILSEIQVTGNGIGFRNYFLEHNNDVFLGYQTLKNINEISGDGTKSYNPTNFIYGISEDTISSPSAIPSGLANVTSENTTTISGDFDGDGAMDFVAYPTIGTDAKKKFWLYNNINNGAGYTLPNEVVSGSFDDIFPSTWLNSNNKMGDRQGITAIQRIPYTYEIDFNTYVANNYGGAGVMYSKPILFPTTLVSYYNFYGNIVLAKKYLSGDFNGDGLSDIVAIDKRDTSAGYSNKVFFIDLDSRKTKNFWNQAGILSNNFLDNDKIEATDINGDGKTDILHFTNGSLKVYTLNDANQLTLLWSYADANIVTTNRSILLGDYNGDGKMDFIISKNAPPSPSTPPLLDNYTFYKFLSTGAGIIKTTETYPFYDEGTGQDSGGYYSISLIPIDFNGDGKTDIVHFKSLYGNTYGGGNIKITIYDNDKNNFTNTTTPYDSGLSSYIIKYPIPIFLSPNTNNRYFEIAALTGTNFFTFTSNKDFSKERLLNTVTTGNGVTETITYKPLQQENYDSIYTPSPNIETFPNIDINVAPNFKVVSKLEKHSETTYKKQLFAYSGAVSNVDGFGFLGFRSTMRTNWHDDNTQIISSLSKFDIAQRGINTENYTILGYANPLTPNYNTPTDRIITKEGTYTITGTENLVATQRITLKPNSWIKAGSIFTAKINQEANASPNTPTNYITKSILTYESELLSNKVFKIQNIVAQQWNGLDNTGSKTITSFDTYNNPIQSITIATNGTAVEQTTVANVNYEPASTTPYVVGRPTSKTQSVSVTGDTSSSEELYAYTNHLLTQVKKKGNNTNYITEDNIYDSFGNITKKTITVSGLAARETNYEYNPAYPYNGRFLTKSTDIEGLSTLFDYNTSNGNLVSETNPYNLTTTYLYNDPWFKKTKTTDYLGKSNMYAYTRSENVKTKVTTTGDDGSYSEELFDDLGRKIKSGVRDITGNTSKVSYEYDIYDRNIKVSEPYFGTGATQWNETQYDEYGRTSKNISFTTKTVSVSYSGLTTTVNDGTKTKISTKNAIGNVVTMTDQPGGIIDYTYFANGNLKTTNYDGVVTTIEQDGWGRKTKLTDPSAGTYTYAYNGFGETTSETTPNGTTTYALNAVGKLTAKSISGSNTNSSTVYNYNGTTKLLDSSIFTNTLEAGAVTTNTYSYDSYKRLVGTTEVTPYATFSKTIDTFDAFGRVETETTSGTANGKTSSKTIKNTYKNSYAWQILDNVSQQMLWQTNTVNERGQLLTADLGNGIAITNAYDSYGFASQIKHEKTGASPANIMTLITTFDEKKGNLKSRNHNIFNWSEDFTTSYDELDRLKSYKNAQGVVVTQTYNEDGRIDVNTLGKYNYTNTAKRYQNTSITLTPDALTYYQNRGIAAIPSPTATRALDITYNTFKSPVDIKEDGIDNLSFVYNDNNDRSTMFYGSTNPDKNLRPNRKYYSADGSMEIKQNISGVTEFVTYIGGDGYSAPIVLKSDGTTQNYLYLHRDYQGSILAITDANATVLEKRLFDAWGSLITVQNGAGVALAGLTILDRGYTGHEHLQSVGLINMNARLYDPKLHRFLQPDNYVEDPSNTQSYNRYGYCWNNPLKTTDVTGNWGGWDDVAAMLIGGVINWGAHGFQMNMQGLKAFAIGAVAGELALYTGGAAFTAAGGAAAGGGGFVAGAFGAMVGYATSQPFLNSANHVALGDPLMTMGEYATGIALAGVTGGAINGISAKLNGNTFWKGTPPRIKVQPITIYIKQVGEGGNAAIKTGDYKITGQPTEPDFISNKKLPSTTQTSTAPTANKGSFYRGGNSTELSPADIRSGLDKGSGLMQPGKGLSINTDKMNVNIQKYGGAFEVDLKSIPQGLELTNFPQGSTHFLISPIEPMSSTIFQTQLNQIKLIQFNSILNGH